MICTCHTTDFSQLRRLHPNRYVRVFQVLEGSKSVKRKTKSRLGLDPVWNEVLPVFNMPGVLLPDVNMRVEVAYRDPADTEIVVAEGRVHISDLSPNIRRTGWFPLKQAMFRRAASAWTLGGKKYAQTPTVAEELAAWLGDMLNRDEVRCTNIHTLTRPKAHCTHASPWSLPSPICCRFRTTRHGRTARPM